MLHIDDGDDDDDVSVKYKIYPRAPAQNLHQEKPLSDGRRNSLTGGKEWTAKKDNREGETFEAVSVHTLDDNDKNFDGLAP